LPFTLLACALLDSGSKVEVNNLKNVAVSSPYTLAAKRLLKVCRQELAEIETCPECYTNAHTKPESWFIEACVRFNIK